MKSFSIIVSLCIMVFSMSAQEYRRGHYYDLNNNRIDGFMYYSFDNTSTFRFVKILADHVTKIGPSEANAFVIGVDSFTVLKNFKTGGLFNKVDEGFVRVLVSGKVNLYVDYSSVREAGSSQTHQVKTFLLKRAGENAIIKVPQRGKQKFRNEMLSFFDDDESIKDQIRSKEYIWELLPEMVSKYNSHHK